LEGLLGFFTMTTTSAAAAKITKERSMTSTAGSQSRSHGRAVLLMAIFLAMALCSFSIWSSLNLQGAIHDNDFSIDPIQVAKLEMRTPQPNPVVPSRRYHEIPFEEFENRHDTMTAYSSSTEIRRSSWFHPTKICKETCCAETVAISLHQDDLKIINTLDGLDLADILIQKYRNPPHYEFFAPSLQLDMVPCFQPGTIIHIDNHRDLTHYFFHKVRPHVQVPYILMTSESDDYSPNHADSLNTDDLLLKWYGQDIDLDRIPADVRENATTVSKMTAFPLGLSKHHPQSPYLSRYLQLNNYTNPFVGEKKLRWIEWANNAGGNNAEADDLLFVKFGIVHAKRRQHIFDTLCNSSSSSSHQAKYKKDPISCQDKTSNNHETYMAASRHLFGVSPPGAGTDCYRTYELLLLGVIPIVPAKEQGNVGLFEGLPVIEVPDLLTSKRSREDLVTIMKDYIQSPAFQSATFDGWERLFLKYWRRKLLKDTGREKDILRDEHGREYYQAWKYTTTKEQPSRIFCSEGVICQ
jgi:hypothetical protein